MERMAAEKQAYARYFIHKNKACFFCGKRRVHGNYGLFVKGRQKVLVKPKFNIAHYP